MEFWWEHLRQWVFWWEHLRQWGGLLDKYDFDYKKGRTGRNVATWLGKTVAGKGTSYNIFNYGTGLFLQKPAPIKLERGPKF